MGSEGTRRRGVPEPIPIVHDPLVGQKPRHRGRMHFVAFLASIPLGFVLVVAGAHTPSARIASAVFALSVTGLFGTSALYNLSLGTPRLRPWMRWVDHAMIYVLIAGSYTPVSWLALPRSWSIPLLAIVWIAAVGGMVLKLTSLKRFRRVGGTLYVTMGWMSVFALPQLVQRLTTTSVVLLAIGGALYTIGGILLLLRRPNPHAHFGYHEVWHTFVVLAVGCHFAMTYLTVDAVRV